jgi:hypothetical protein
MRITLLKIISRIYSTIWQFLSTPHIKLCPSPSHHRRKQQQFTTWTRVRKYRRQSSSKGKRAVRHCSLPQTIRCDNACKCLYTVMETLSRLHDFCKQNEKDVVKSAWYGYGGRFQGRAAEMRQSLGGKCAFQNKMI